MPPASRGRGLPAPSDARRVSQLPRYSAAASCLPDRPLHRNPLKRCAQICPCPRVTSIALSTRGWQPQLRLPRRRFRRTSKRHAIHLPFPSPCSLDSPNVETIPHDLAPTAAAALSPVQFGAPPSALLATAGGLVPRRSPSLKLDPLQMGPIRSTATRVEKPPAWMHPLEPLLEAPSPRGDGPDTQRHPHRRRRTRQQGPPVGLVGEPAAAERAVDKLGTLGWWTARTAPWHRLCRGSARKRDDHLRQIRQQALPHKVP
mmetsp:Transcript_69453/g.165549  ORF Transcript_69453/g.165549 Transcript_69453/m.165549 type:complete len:259 (+) Transcript_69453:2099-2875(+)